MISQNNKNLCNDINNYGCLFLALLATKRQDWQADEVMAIYNTAKGQGMLGDKCYVKSFDAILALIDSPYRWSKRVDIVNGNLPPFEIGLCRYVTNGANRHFMLHHRTMIYNPYDALEASYRLNSLLVDRLDVLTLCKTT